MKLVIDFDIEEFVKEAEEEAISKLKQKLREECTGAIRNAESQLWFADNFQYHWDRVNNPETRKSIADIIYDWVKIEFAKEVREHCMNLIDSKTVMDELKKDDRFIFEVADRIARKKSFCKEVALKYGDEYKEEHEDE